MVNEVDVRATIIKQSRRNLLTVLKMFYNTSQPYKSIRLTLPEVEDHHLKIDLSYLCDKGYVQRMNVRPNQSWEDREFVLTDTGVETADYINKDPALEP